MKEEVEVAYHEGKILCAFTTRMECKEYIKEKYPDIDAFDVSLKTEYLTPIQPGSYGPVPR